MQENSPIALSVVVPVLDEARTIERTLQTLVVQDAVDEVIVVDNGSADDTIDIVRAFHRNHPRVRLIHEPNKGIAPARNAGFDAARGEFIARTDADTLVASDWAATIENYFSENPETGALTGLCTYHDSPVGFFLKFGQWLLIRSGNLGGQVGNMYGPNMAIRHDAWMKVRERTHARNDVIEDLDLALCLCKNGIRIDQLTGMRARTSARRRRDSPLARWHFHTLGLRTLRDQDLPVLPIHRFLITAAWLTHTLQWPLYRFWDFDRRRFRLHPG